MNMIWLVWKTLIVKIYHFRRNCTVLLDHLCEITKENGSKHDTKSLILSGPSASENSSYFIAGFSIRIGVDSKPYVGRERELCRPKGWAWENFYKMNCSRAQFPAVRNILLFSCLPHTKAKTFILWTSLTCWPDRPCSACPTITYVLSHFRIQSFVWLNMPGYSASVDRSAGLYTVRSCV